MKRKMFPTMVVVCMRPPDAMDVAEASVDTQVLHTLGLVTSSIDLEILPLQNLVRSEVQEFVLKCTDAVRVDPEVVNDLFRSTKGSVHRLSSMTNALLDANVLVVQDGVCMVSVVELCMESLYKLSTKTTPVS